jgi:hypothetical protein
VACEEEGVQEFVSGSLPPLFVALASIRSAVPPALRRGVVIG